MLEPRTPIARLVAVVLAALVIVGACASTTSPSGSPAAFAPPSAQALTASQSPTPSPTPRAAFVTTADATFGLFSHGDTVVMVGGPTGTDAKSLLTAIIKANA
jgi:hypothetical protein